MYLKQAGAGVCVKHGGPADPHHRNRHRLELFIELSFEPDGDALVRPVGNVVNDRLSRSFKYARQEEGKRANLGWASIPPNEDDLAGPRDGPIDRKQRLDELFKSYRRCRRAG